MKKQEQLYFRSVDDEFCLSLEHFLQDAKIAGLREIKLVRAIKDTDTKYFVWCSHYDEVTERALCRKIECNAYSSKSGRGVCKHRGQLYLHDEEVTIDVETGKEI